MRKNLTVNFFSGAVLLGSACLFRGLSNVACSMLGARGDGSILLRLDCLLKPLILGIFSREVSSLVVKALLSSPKIYRWEVALMLTTLPSPRTAPYFLLSLGLSSGDPRFWKFSICLWDFLTLLRCDPRLSIEFDRTCSGVTSSRLRSLWSKF